MADMVWVRWMWVCGMLACGCGRTKGTEQRGNVEGLCCVIMRIRGIRDNNVMCVHCNVLR